MFALKIWGCRAGIASGSFIDEELGERFETIKYGAATSCYEIRMGKQVVIVDMGTGSKWLGKDLLRRAGNEPLDLIVFFTHTHWDHIQGFPYFLPFFSPRHKFQLFGPIKTKIRPSTSTSLEYVLQGQQMYPNFPVQLNQLSAHMSFTDVNDGAKLSFRKNPATGEFHASEAFTVSTGELNHPDGCFGYRFEYQGHAIVIATDTEHYSVPNLKLQKIAKDADILVHDAQYSDEEYPHRTGWGHSTRSMAIREAESAGVKTLLFTHHDASASDQQLDQISALAISNKITVMPARERLLMKVLE